MKRYLLHLGLCVGLLSVGGDASGRGWGGGGVRGGGGGGSFSGSFSHTQSGGWCGFSSFSGSNAAGGSYSGDRTTSSQSGNFARGASSSYDRTWESASGASINTSGSRSAGQTAFGGSAVSGNRDTTLTTASGQTYSGSRQGAAASGAMGRTVGGASGSIDGRSGTADWNTAFSGNKYGTMNHYSSASATTATGTKYWSNSYTTSHASTVRTNYGYYNCFHPAWYTAHPGTWVAVGWAAGAAYSAPTYTTVSSFCDLGQAAPVDYDYGGTVVISNDNLYVSGNDTGVTATQYAQQAVTLADKGQAAPAEAKDEWKPLGVYALVQAEEKTSNNIFQLAVNAGGTIRGNYYDGLMDTTTEVYGSLDKTTQRAAWTIGKKKDRVFEAGFYNLTQPECACLIHIGVQKTMQMMLVRVEQPAK